MKREGCRWAKIRGAYRLSRRSIARIIAAISAALLAFHAATSALTPADEALRRRASGAMCRILVKVMSLADDETDGTFTYGDTWRARGEGFVGTAPCWAVNMAFIQLEPETEAIALDFDVRGAAEIKLDSSPRRLPGREADGRVLPSRRRGPLCAGLRDARDAHPHRV